MWCRACQQDVPAVATAGDSRHVSCARCGQELRQSSEANVTNARPTAFPIHELRGQMPRDSYNDWKLDDELREAQRLVRLIKTQRPQSDAGNDIVPTDKAASSGTIASSKASVGSSFLSWSLSGLGLAGLVCGCALLIWSLVSQRDELWTIGLPIALVSQVILVCGVLLRRDGDDPVRSEGNGDASATLVQVQSTAGGMRPSGLSVHFSNSGPTGDSLDNDRLRREIEAVMRRQRAA